MKSLISILSIVFIGVWLPAAGQDHPDRVVQAEVPQGKVTAGEFSGSRLFPGTQRQYSVYVPAQYREDQPAKLMVFMDGSGYAKLDGAFRVPVVFDNLIHQQAMPVTIAVFVNPGTILAAKPGVKDRSNRSFEYDSLGDRYANFLVDEFLPVALKGLNVSKDPADRAACGISSSGICAFTVAWEKPDQFGKVLSHIGSFTNIRGGWAYPGMVRKTKNNPKPIKVYLQDGKGDLNNLHGNWPLGNQDLAAALQFSGYQYKLVMTEGGHSGKWGGEELPNALRWLWSKDTESTNIPVVETKPQWEPHPDAVPKDGVPRGVVEQMPSWESKSFAGTIRNWSVYVPAQYKSDEPAAMMIFQDGEGMQNVTGRWRIPVVFDNLIARGDMPPLSRSSSIPVATSPSRNKATGPRTEVMNTTASAIGISAFCWRKSCLKWRSVIASLPTLRCGRLVVRVRERFVRSRPPGNVQMSSERSIPALAASPICGAAMSTRCLSARPNRNRCEFIWPTPVVTWTTPLEAGRGRIS